MKRHFFVTIGTSFGLIITLGLAAGPARAEGPRTPIEAFQRLQGQNTRIHQASGRRLQTNPTLGRPLLKAPTTRGVLRGQTKPTQTKRTRTKKVTKSTVSFCADVRLCGDGAQPKGRTTVTKSRTKNQPNIKSPRPARRGSWIARVLTNIRDLIKEL